MTGFSDPNYTMIPNDFFDISPDMDLAELRILICLMRATFGFHRPTITMTIRELARSTKLTPKSVMSGSSKLEDRGLVRRSVIHNKPTTWECVLESNTPVRDQILHGVLPNTGKTGVKERIKENKENGFDLVDGYLELSQSPGIKKMVRVEAILSYLGSTLRINTETKRWKEFANFADGRQQEGEKIERFVAWLTSQDKFNIQYWSPARMLEMWPQAFTVSKPEPIQYYQSQEPENAIPNPNKTRPNIKRSSFTV